MSEEIIRPSTPPLSFEDMFRGYEDVLNKMKEDCQRNYFKQDPSLPPSPEIEALNDVCYILRDNMRKEKMRKLEQEIEKLKDENLALRMEILFFRANYGPKL